jgi:hypothetical protein
METLVSILRAAHCKSTHHFFAIDSLWEITSSRGLALSRLLLEHFDQYLKGAKDPDNVFKDFENHVVHVSDGYWGGAAKAGKKWLELALQQLQSGKWKEAAYSLGVLSHYFSDPFMPLHTAQSARETAIHRPLEWSVCCCYGEIYASACSDASLEPFELQQGTEWLMDTIHAGAMTAHSFYEGLLDDYNLDEGRRFPKLALGSYSKRVLAQLFVAVHTAWGSALDRIANETTIPLPDSSLAIATLLAGIQVPAKKIVQAIDSAEQRQTVERILEEYQRTGSVTRNLTSEQRVVRKVRQEQPNLRPRETEIQRIETKVAPSIADDPKPVPQAQALRKPVPLPKREPEAKPEPTAAKNRLTLTSPIVDAPAIGPKTATRFQAQGYHTIQDFLSVDAKTIAADLDTSWISERLVAQWQCQAKLSLEVDRLTAVGAGLLVLSGVKSIDQLASQNAAKLRARFLEVIQTGEGKRLVREQDPPSLSTIEAWIVSAQRSGAKLASAS